MTTEHFIGAGDKTTCDGITQKATTECEITLENGQQARPAQIDHVVMHADDFLTSIEG